MKKVLSIILVLALLLPVLAGCQSSAPAANQTDPPAPQETTVPEETTLPPETTVATPVSTDLTTVTLTRDEAISIALKDAGLKKDQVYDLDAEIDRDNGVLHYDVDFEKDGYDYEYEIHAESGKILKSRKERD